jgi:hypothetical protein
MSFKNAIGFFVKRGGITLDPRFQAVLNAWTTQPTEADIIRWDTMVKGLVASGRWDKSDRIFYSAVHTNSNGEAQIDWKAPTDVNRAFSLTNAPAFTAYKGFLGANGKYIKTKFKPATHGVKYTLNSGSFSVLYYQNATRTTLYEVCGAWQTVGGELVNRIDVITPTPATGQRFFAASINSLAVISDTNSETTGRKLVTSSRTAIDSLVSYSSGVEKASSTERPPYASLHDLEIFLLGCNLDGSLNTASYVARNQSVCLIGEGVTVEQELTDSAIIEASLITV